MHIHKSILIALYASAALSRPPTPQGKQLHEQPGTPMSNPQLKADRETNGHGRDRPHAGAEHDYVGNGVASKDPRRASNKISEGGRSHGDAGENVASTPPIHGLAAGPGAAVAGGSSSAKSPALDRLVQELTNATKLNPEEDDSFLVARSSLGSLSTMHDTPGAVVPENDSHGEQGSVKPSDMVSPVAAARKNGDVSPMLAVPGGQQTKQRREERADHFAGAVHSSVDVAARVGGCVGGSRRPDGKAPTVRGAGGKPLEAWGDVGCDDRQPAAMMEGTGPGREEDAGIVGGRGESGGITSGNDDAIMQRGEAASDRGRDSHDSRGLERENPAARRGGGSREEEFAGGKKSDAAMIGGSNDVHRKSVSLDDGPLSGDHDGDFVPEAGQVVSLSVWLACLEPPRREMSRRRGAWGAVEEEEEDDEESEMVAVTWLFGNDGLDLDIEQGKHVHKPLHPAVMKRRNSIELANACKLAPVTPLKGSPNASFEDATPDGSRSKFERRGSSRRSLLDVDDGPALKREDNSGRSLLDIDVGPALGVIVDSGCGTPTPLAQGVKPPDNTPSVVERRVAGGQREAIREGFDVGGIEGAMERMNAIMQSHMLKMQAELQAQLEEIAAAASPPRKEAPQAGVGSGGGSAVEKFAGDLEAVTALASVRQHNQSSDEFLFEAAAFASNNPGLSPEGSALPRPAYMRMNSNKSIDYPGSNSPYSPVLGKRRSQATPRLHKTSSFEMGVGTPPMQSVLSAGSGFDHYLEDDDEVDERPEGGRFSDHVLAVMGARMVEDQESRRWYVGGTEEEEEMKKVVRKRREDMYEWRSLYCLSLDAGLRTMCIRVIEHNWFDRLILFTIFVNCVVMALDEPVNMDPNSQVATISNQLGFLFQAIFTAECILKIISLGFAFGPKSYVRDGWNCLDLFIVVTGFIEYLPSTEGASDATVLRTFRLLRPLRALRAVGRFKNLRMLVELLIGCIPMLANVFGLISFIFFVFGILGVQIYGAGLRGRCYSNANGIVKDASDDGVCGLSEGMSFSPCDEGDVCLTIGQNIQYGFTSFDDIISAMLVIFQVMIQEDWTELMYAIWDAYTIWMWPYFILLNALGPMFAIQLFIVVVANKYQQVKHAQNEAENAATQLFEVKVGILSANIPRIAKDPTADPYVSVRVDDHVKDTRVIKNGGPAEWNEYYVFPVRSVASRAEISVKRWQRYGAHPSIAHISIPVGMLDTEVEGTDKWYEIESEGGDGEGTIHVRTQWRECDEDDWVDLPEVVDDDDDVEDEDAEDADLSAWGLFRAYSKSFAESSFLSNVTIIVILANTVAMACEHDCDENTVDYCRVFKGRMEGCNIVFTSFFALEMLIKIVGLGPVAYLRDTSNLFDVIIVSVSLVELESVIMLYQCYLSPPDAVTGEYINCSESSSGLAVLRAFRLIRVLRIGKLVKMFPQIQRQLKVRVWDSGFRVYLVILIPQIQRKFKVTEKIKSRLLLPLP